MTIHLCRNLSSLSSSLSPATGMYFLSIFMHHTLGYRYKSSINFNITSSSFLKASFNQNVPFTYLASITDIDTSVLIPPAVYALSDNDVNRILALKSDNNPRHNSGLFRITSVDVGTNKATIDYQSTELPINDSSLTWRIYASEHEVTSSWVTSSNGSVGGYTSHNDSSCSRLMLEKDNYLFARLCLEDSSMVLGNIPAGCSITVGANDRLGLPEFERELGFLNGPLYFDTTSSLYQGTAIGLNTRMNSTSWTSGKFSFTAIGDDVNGTTLAFCKNEDFVTGGNSLVCFGYPAEFSNEILPKKDIINHLFIAGGTTQTQEITVRSGFSADSHLQGLAWSGMNTLAPCILSQYSDSRNIVPSIRSLTTANKNQFNNMTEVYNVDLVVGTLKSNLSPIAESIFRFTPKVLGTLPFLKIGRTNYANWSLTPDKSMYHLFNGIFIDWSGSMLQTNATGSENTYLLPINYDNSSVEVLQLEPVMYDPEDEEIIIDEKVEKDIDANRFKKTYSYQRQQHVDLELTRPKIK
jgi:hypothetical protein